jgi:hypothetical protein
MRLPESLETWIKLLSLAGAAVAFAWGVYQFRSAQRAHAETRRIEATRPFLDRQLKLYTDATQAAATLATSTKTDEIAASKSRFWSLYWGELALVEDHRVEAAMVEFGRLLADGKSGVQLQETSLQLAHACRDSLADSWGVAEWRDPKEIPFAK